MNKKMQVVQKIEPMNTQGEVTRPKDAIAIRWSAQVQVGEKTILSFETFTDQMMPIKATHALVDMLMAVTDRQRKKYELMDITNYKLQALNQLMAMQGDLDRLISSAEPRSVPGRSKPVEPNQKLRTDIGNTQNTIAKQKELIEKLAKDIEVRTKELELT